MESLIQLIDGTYPTTLRHGRKVDALTADEWLEAH
jgi:hypothetical protein